MVSSLYGLQLLYDFEEGLSKNKDQGEGAIKCRYGYTDSAYLRQKNVPFECPVLLSDSTRLFGFAFHSQLSLLDNSYAKL